MEYVEGTKIDDIDGLNKLGVNLTDVAKTLTSIFSLMIFRFGFVHCDAHPGNIFVRKNKKAPNGFEIILLDHGLYRKVDN